MEPEGGNEHPWGGPEDMRNWAAELQGGLDYTEVVEAAARSAVPPAGRRRLLRTSLRASAYAGAALALFLGGWFAHVWFQDDSTPSSSSDRLVRALLPEEGVTLDVTWGDVPQQLFRAGVIDIEKFGAAAQQAGSPLTADQLMLLAEGSDEPLTIDANNAYFTLNVLWALGLANDNAILTQGPMAQRGWVKAGGYASTGGWTIGEEAGPQYLATLDLIRLTSEQQAVLSEVAYNSYRPCCGNMTAFPDCNHGMAALALAELMASQGASTGEIFQALKEISPFWFPNQYYQLALHFERQDQEWDDVEPRLVMGKDYSSAGGWKEVSARLQQEGALTASGPGGGKASGCAP